VTQADLTPPSDGKQRAAQARCDAMVRHARAQIMAVGVDRFSVNEVLRATGGSKATLVKYFGDRSGLIAAAIGAEAQAAVAGLALDEAATLPLGAALEQALAGVLRFYLRPGSIALYRAVVSAADPVGSLGFYRQGHAALVDAVAAVIDARKGSEVRTDIDSRSVADQLLHAIRAGAYEQALIGLAEGDLSSADIAARARTTAALVLPALRIDPEGLG
jgi:AcrR family transcriptional regulator